MSFFTITAIKQAAENSGNHFFERGAMRFFRSRIMRGAYPDPVKGGAYFVTSERFESMHGSAARAYSVRFANDDASRIETIGEFNSYKTAAQARRAIREMVK